MYKDAQLRATAHYRGSIRSLVLQVFSYDIPLLEIKRAAAWDSLIVLHQITINKVEIILQVL